MVANSKSWVLVLAFLSPLTKAHRSTDGFHDCGVTSIGSNCLEPVARGSANFEFKPIFPQDVTFVYAFDVQDEEELKTDPIAPGETPVSDAKIGYWLEYAEAELTASDHQETYMVVLTNENITGTPSGGHNGCDGVLGAECSENLAQFMKRQIVAARSRAFADFPAVFAILDSPIYDDDIAYAIGNLSCPTGIFDEPYFVRGAGGTVNEKGSKYSVCSTLSFFKSSLLTTARHVELAKENGDSTGIMPSGNATSSYFTKRLYDITYDELIKRAAVALIARVPLQGELYQDKENLQLEMVCAKAELVDDGIDGENDDDVSNESGSVDPDTDGAALVVSGFWTTLVVAGVGIAASL